MVSFFCEAIFFVAKGLGATTETLARITVLSHFNTPCFVCSNFFLKLAYCFHFQIREAISRLTNKVLYDVRLIRDNVTQLSRGFAFVELATAEVYFVYFSFLVEGWRMIGFD